MAGFKFKLQAVLDLRLHAERQRQLAVAALEAERVGLEGLIVRAQAEIRSHKEDWRARLGGASRSTVDLAGVRVQAAESLRMQVVTQRQALALAGVYKRLEGARAELRRAMTERRAVELLRERRFAEWRRQQSRRENAELDEIGTMAAGRRAAEADGVQPRSPGAGRGA